MSSQDTRPLSNLPTSDHIDKLVYHSHLKTICEEVNLSMTCIKSLYWIPALRQ